MREGDVVGAYLRLPSGAGANPVAREVVTWKGTHGAFYADPVEREIPALAGAPSAGQRRSPSAVLSAKLVPRKIALACSHSLFCDGLIPPFALGYLPIARH